MAYCRYCGAEVAEDGAFCTNCGVRNNLNVTPALARQGVPGRGQARASMILGIIGLVLSMIVLLVLAGHILVAKPFGEAGIIMPVYGLVLGLFSIASLLLNLVSRSRGYKSKISIVGLALSLLGILNFYFLSPVTAIFYWLILS